MKGSRSGSSGGSGATEKPPPGRSARSPAMMVFRPVSGSTRTCGIASARVAIDVGDQVRVTPVGPGVDVGALALRVIEDRHRVVLGRLDRARDLLLRVGVG